MADGKPVLLPGGAQSQLAVLRDRIAGFVPEWRDLGEDDAGVALVRLFGLQIDPILARANRLPDKALVEFLRTAGITPAPPRSANAIVCFTPEDDAPPVTEIPEGFALLSARADSETGDVTWETEAPLSVPAATLAERHVFDGEVALPAPEGAAFRPFGDRPEAGAALYLGFAVGVPARARLSLAFVPATDETTAPVTVGGVEPRALPRPTLRWEASTDRGFVPVEAMSDDTAGLTRTGIVTLDLPANWAATRPPILAEGAPLNWLRLRLVNGRCAVPPHLAAIHPHAVRVAARETLRDEFPILESTADGHSVRLTRAPVLPGFVVLEIDETGQAGDLFALPDADTPAEHGSIRRWREVDTLSGQPPDARVFTLDSETGVIAFGDDREGRAPPQTRRAIAIRSYAVTLGAAGSVAAGTIDRMRNRLNGIASVKNPLPAAGGAAAESQAAAIARGPAGIKARGRAVSTGDMALMARFADGADILRAYAISGINPSLPGAVLPGHVGIFVIPRRHPSKPPDTRPRASSQTLSAVARYLARQVGPLGARISVANPRYQVVRVDATLTVAAGQDAAAIARAVRAAFDGWLNPETRDWPIGAVLGHADLTHVALGADPGILSVPFLAITLDGIGHAACEDVQLKRFALPWPGHHRLAVNIEEAPR
jgi:predicted phage baseplate assembly protein